MSGFAVPQYTFFYNGQVAASGSVYVYQSGTTTPVTVYSDGALTSPITNPINLDSNGQAKFYVSGTVNLKLVAFNGLNGSGILIQTIDPVYPVSAGGASTSIPWAVAGGTADAITAAYSPVNTFLTDGLLLSFRATAANATTTPTFSPDGLTSHVITQKGGAPLVAANIAANLAEYIIRYNLINTRWELLNPSVVVPTAVITFSAISGFLPSSIAGTSTTATLTVAAGQTTDSTNAKILAAGPFSWAVTNGNAANGYRGGATLPNSTTIHFFIITDSNNANPASFADTSVTPSLPSGYSSGFFRRIFSLRTSGAGALLAGISIEEGGGSQCFYLTTIVQDINTAALSTTAVLFPLTVPNGIKVEPLIRLACTAASNQIIMTSPDETDVAPGNNSTSPGDDLSTNAAGGPAVSHIRLTTDTSGQIRGRATATSSLFGYTRGWIDFRRS